MTGPPIEPTDGPRIPEIPPPPPETPTPPSAPPRRNRILLIVVAAVVALIMASVAVALSRGGNDHARAGTPTSTSSPSPGPSIPPLPAAPQSLSAHAKSFAVSLTWEPGVGGGTVGGYTVYRDHKAVGVVQSGGSSYVDKTALPKSGYLYEVEAYGIGSDVVSAGRASIQVHTPTAPPSTAVLTGIFNVHLHLTSSYGLSGVGDTSAGWRFKPTCDEGPCNVQLLDIHHTLPPTQLTRKGAVYEGSGSAVLGTCGGTKVTSTFHITLHVTKASTSSSEWRASKFEGTFTTSAPSMLGCVSAGTTYAASGKTLR